MKYYFFRDNPDIIAINKLSADLQKCVKYCIDNHYIRLLTFEGKQYIKEIDLEEASMWYDKTNRMSIDIFNIDKDKYAMLSHLLDINGIYHNIRSNYLFIDYENEKKVKNIIKLCI